MTEKSKDGLDEGEMKLEQTQAKMSRMKIIKNLLIVSFAFMFLFTAFQSMSNLQSSLNRQANLGTGGLAIVYGGLIISCMFVPTWLISILGCKWTIAASMICYILYMAAQFYATWGLIAPASFIVGLGAAPLWSAKCTYLTQTGDWYASMTKADKDDIINRFFGLFFMMFQTSQIWGNLISSTVLATPVDANYTVDYETCGANVCPEKSNTTAIKPAMEKIYTMLGIYLACACCAFLIIVIFLDKITLDKEDKKKAKLSPKLLLATFLHLGRSPKQMLLVPITMYSGIEQAFIGADFTKAFVTCPFGVWNVGYVMICYGVADALCSITFGRLVQYVGHITFFILAAIIHLGVQITLLLWLPSPDLEYVLYILAALWGMGDAVWQTQINALYGYLFSDNSEAAFSNYRLWESVGFIVAFVYAGYICTNVKLYVCMGVLSVGMIGYFIVEVMEHRGRSHDLKQEKS